MPEQIFLFWLFYFLTRDDTMMKRIKFILGLIIIIAAGTVTGCDTETIPDDYNAVSDIPEIPERPDNPGTSEKSDSSRKADEITNIETTSLESGVYFSWKNPTNSKYRKVKITFSPEKESVSQPIEKKITTTSFSLVGEDWIESEEIAETSYIRIDGLDGNTEYTFSFYLVDSSGNESLQKTIKAIPKEDASPSSETDFAVRNLTVYYSVADGRIIFLNWKNPDIENVAGIEISYRKYSSDDVIKTFRLEKENSMLPSSYEIPTIENDGTKYVVTVKTISSAGKEFIKKVEVTAESSTQAVPKVNAFRFVDSEGNGFNKEDSNTSLVSLGTDVYAEITGTNLDLCENPKIKLFNLIDNEVEECVLEIPVSAENTSFGKKINAKLLLPSSLGTYTAKFVIGEITQYDKPKFKIIEKYSDPRIDSIKIPPVNRTYLNKEIPITVIGEGFTRNLSYDFEGLEKNRINFASDKKVVIYANTPSSATDTNVKVSIFSNDNIDEMLSTGEASLKFTDETFSPGDIILSDGSKYSYDAETIKSFVVDENNKPVAVIINLKYGGSVGVGLGLKYADALEWAKDGTLGHSYNFAGIRAISKLPPNHGIGFNEDSDNDGSDNFDYIKYMDPEGTKDAKTNYPAFYYAETYGTEILGLSETEEFASGWYILSFGEMFLFAKTNEHYRPINDSLCRTKCGFLLKSLGIHSEGIYQGFSLDEQPKILLESRGYAWSSSQYHSTSGMTSSTSACRLRPFTFTEQEGTVYGYSFINKASKQTVIVVRDFYGIK